MSNPRSLESGADNDRAAAEHGRSANSTANNNPLLERSRADDDLRKWLLETYGYSDSGKSSEEILISPEVDPSRHKIDYDIVV